MMKGGGESDQGMDGRAPEGVGEKGGWVESKILSRVSSQRFGV